MLSSEDFARFASQVDDLLTSPPVRTWFRWQLKKAVRLQENYKRDRDAHDRCLAEHYRSLQKDPRLTNREAGPLEEHKDWQWGSWTLPLSQFSGGEVLSGKDPGEIEGWGPPDLLDETKAPQPPIDSFYPFEQRDRPKKEVLPTLCFLLAAAHDIGRPTGKGFEPLLKGIKLPKAYRVYLDSGSSFGMDGLDPKTLETALEAVRQHAAQVKVRIVLIIIGLVFVISIIWWRRSIVEIALSAAVYAVVYKVVSAAVEKYILPHIGGPSRPHRR
jgi:hypothetical protein